MNQEKLNQLKEKINRAKHIVFFGGAGVSTESGIPDFRSKNGLYNQHDIQFDAFEPEYLLSHSCLRDRPEVFFEFYRQKLDTRNIQPNITHLKLAEWEKNGRDVTIVTQNIDGLHQKAGSKSVLEIHGTAQRVYCQRCGATYGAEAILDSNEAIPKCSCGGKLRPDITLYEESLPDEFIIAGERIKEADLIIVGGTSLMVYPANTLIPNHYDERLVIINNQATEKDCFARLVFHENLGEIFKEL